MLAEEKVPSVANNTFASGLLAINKRLSAIEKQNQALTAENNNLKQQIHTLSSALELAVEQFKQIKEIARAFDMAANKVLIMPMNCGDDKTNEQKEAEALLGNTKLLLELVAEKNWLLIQDLTNSWHPEFKKSVWSRLSAEQKDEINKIKSEWEKLNLPAEIPQQHKPHLSIVSSPALSDPDDEWGVVVSGTGTEAFDNFSQVKPQSATPIGRFSQSQPASNPPMAGFEKNSDPFHPTNWKHEREAEQAGKESQTWEIAWERLREAWDHPWLGAFFCAIPYELRLDMLRSMQQQHRDWVEERANAFIRRCGEAIGNRYGDW